LKVGKTFIKSGLAGGSHCGTDENGDTIYPPLFAFGASSGGDMIAKLASVMKKDADMHKPFIFSALNVQIFAPSSDWDVPTIFTVMKNDQRTFDKVNKLVNKKFQEGPFRMIETSGSKAVTPTHFKDANIDDPRITDEVSSAIYDDLVTMGVIDSSTGFLRADPRQMEVQVTSVWQKYDTLSYYLGESKDKKTMMKNVQGQHLPFGLSPQVFRPLKVEEVIDANSIWLIEELNVAWDEHEITAEAFESTVIPFFLYHAQPK